MCVNFWDLLNMIHSKKDAKLVKVSSSRKVLGPKMAKAQENSTSGPKIQKENDNNI